jgi:hypothetical protein
MGYITKFGTLWGAIPQTAGRVFWVAPAADYTVEGRSYSASDENDGLSPERACRTMNYVFDNLVSANVGDVVVLLPGNHIPQNTAGTATSLAMDTAGVTLTGLPGGVGNFTRQKTAIVGTTLAGDQAINVTAANCEIAHLHFVPVTTDSAIDASADADYLHIHDCSFDMATAAANTGTIGIDFIGAASDALIQNCYFHSDGAQGPAIVAGATVGCIVQGCIFLASAGTWANVMTQAAAGRRLIVRGCLWDATSATITAGCLGTTGGDVDQAFFVDNRNSVGVTKMVDGYDGGDAVIAVNYIGTLGGGTGGTLVTATT